MHRPASAIERLARSWLCAGLLLLTCASAAWAQVTTAEVTQLQVERNEDGVVLSAAVHFDLPQVVDMS